MVCIKCPPMYCTVGMHVVCIKCPPMYCTVGMHVVCIKCPPMHCTVGVLWCVLSVLLCTVLWGYCGVY